MDTDPSVKKYELDDSGSNWITRIPHVKVSRLWGDLLTTEFLVILVVVNSVMDTQLHVTDTSVTDTFEFPSDCSQTDIDDMEEEHEIEES
jgi:hypothetical protein